MATKLFVQPLVLSLLLVWCGVSCSAQQATAEPRPITAEKRAAIAELLEAIDFNKNMLALIDSMAEAEEKQLPELTWEALSNTKEIQDLSAADREALKQSMIENSTRDSKRIRNLMMSKMDLPAVVGQITYKLYDKYFSEGEIKDLIAFYRSPTGRKSIEVMPSLFSESMNETIVALKPKMAEIMNELREEELKRARLEVESKKANKAAPARRHKPE